MPTLFGVPSSSPPAHAPARVVARRRARGARQTRTPTTRVAGINVDASTIPQLEALMNRHRLTSVQLVQFYLHRIEKLNPKLNAVITVSPTALADAPAQPTRRARAAIASPAARASRSSSRTTSTRPACRRPPARGRWPAAARATRSSSSGCDAAGAIVIAKANLSEWANFRSAPSSSGWSGIGGQTNMAYVLDRNPCGSSSGSGVAASADLATVAVGTETDGSIVCPSGANGDVGIKPTLGPREPGRHRPDLRRPGHGRPDHPQRDRRGRRARRHDGRRPQRPRDRGPGRPRAHRLHAVPRPHALEGARIGVWREGTLHDPDDPTSRRSTRSWTPTVAQLEAEGATVVDPARDPDSGPADRPEFAALLCEFKTDIATLPADVHAPRLPEDARGPDRLQRGAHATSRARARRDPWNNRSVSTPRPRAAGRRRLRRTPRATRPPAPRRRSTTRWPRTTSTRSSRRPTARPGSPIR